MLRILHVSDLHFGVHSVAEQVGRMSEMIRNDSFDVVAVSGDLTQRARMSEFHMARVFLDFAESKSKLIVVPGNHDVAWWRMGVPGLMYGKWTKGLARATSGVLRLPGATIIGVNSAQGISPRTLTTRARDLSVIGVLRDRQIDDIGREFAKCGAGERRVVVMHHNLVRGEISKRIGLVNADHILGRFALLGVDLVLCGHDHQEAIHHIQHAGGSMVIAAAGTLTTRSRGKRPAVVNVVELDASRMTVRAMTWDAGRKDFAAGVERHFDRTPPRL